MFFQTLPKKVLILGVPFQIVRTTPIIKDDAVCNGEIDADNYQILIDSKLKRHRAWITLFHEVLHELDVLGNISEDDVEIISRGLYQFLSDNNLLR